MTGSKNYERGAGSEEWYTPTWLFDALGVEFDLDPCAGQSATPCREHWRDKRGLAEPWHGAVWLNPPYGRTWGAIVPWVERFAEHGHGIAIVPNRTCTKWFQDLATRADALLFLRGRVHFHAPSGQSTAPTFGNILVAMGADMAERLSASPIEGFRWRKT